MPYLSLEISKNLISDQGQHWNPDEYRRYAFYVPTLGREVIDLLAPENGERILDLGCGDGELTVSLVDKGCDVVGIDQSVDFVATARSRGLSVVHGDARRLNETELKEGTFDAVFSNAVLHWIKPPEDVITGVGRLLRKGGRFVAEFGGAGNISVVRQALHRALVHRGLDPVGRDPWYFPSSGEYQTLLEENCFTVSTISLFPRPTSIPGSINEWLLVFTAGFFKDLDPVLCQEIRAEVESETSSKLYTNDGTWNVDYVRLRFCAFKQ